MFWQTKCFHAFSVLVFTLLLLTPPAALGDQARPEMSKQMGERAPIFSVATSQGYLANYDRDYYGRHHLVLTFFPAPFTPV